MTLAYLELLDAGIGLVLLWLGVWFLKDRIQRGWMILAFIALQAAWAVFMILYNLCTVTGWLLLVDVVWFVVLVGAVKLAQFGWKIQRSWLELRDAERLAQTLLNHERIEE